MTDTNDDPKNSEKDPKPTTDYQSSSKKNKDKESVKNDEPRAEKVVSGEVITRKKPLGSRFREIFLGGEFKSAGQYVAMEVLLPAFRNLLVDVTTKGVERVVYGDDRGVRRPPPPGGYGPKVTYNAPVQRSYDPRGRANLPDQPSRRTRSGEEFILATRSDAELILERMQDIIDRYDVVSMGDLHELMGIPSSYVEQKWGWVTIRFAQIRQIREGWLLDLPPAEAL